MKKPAQSRWIPPLVAVSLSTLWVLFIAHAMGQPVWEASTWARWDSNHYLTIARDGYRFYSCADGHFKPGTNVDPDAWCGNTSWFPGYPLLISLFSTALRPALAGIVVTWLALFAALYLLWNEYLGGDRTVRNYLLLGIAVCFPGAIYYHAVFPVSLCVFASVAYVYFLQREMAKWAVVCGLCAAFVYPPAGWLVVVGGLAVFQAAARYGHKARKLVEPTAACVAPAVGFLLAIAYQWKDTGNWRGFFLSQAKYDYGGTVPFSRLTHAVSETLFPGESSFFVAAQTLLAGLLVVLACAPLWKLKLRRDPGFLMGALLVVYWALPHFMASPMLSLQRSEALLLPAAFLLGRLPVQTLWALFLTAFVLFTRVSVLFFTDAII